MSVGKFNKALTERIMRAKTMTIIPAIVTAQNGDTIDVTDDKGIELFNVRLLAIIDTEGMTIMPKVGSNVLIGCIGNSPSEYVCIATSEIEYISLIVGDSKAEVKDNEITITHSTTEVKVNASGCSIVRGGESINALLTDLLTAILSMQFVTPTGNTTSLVNAAQFSAIQSRINNILP